MARINYDSHCAACHPLTFDARIKRQAPHRVTPDELKAFLTRVYTDNPPPPAGPPPFPPLPGKPQGARGPSGDAVRAKVDLGLQMLLGGKRACGECHLAADGGELSASTKEVARPAIPDIWYTHARFDHSIHAARGITCAECHPGAYATDDKGLLADYARPRKGAEDVMVPDITNCRQCHAPAPAPGPAGRGLKAKSDCTECHSYHHGVPSHAGRRGNGGRVGGLDPP
jgi:hypothetical protein